jgi:hypothetical protein
MEHFIFQSRRGHCTLHATLFALRLRMAEIPCRVAAGLHGGCRDEATGVYLFTNRDRHAWVEVFFEDCGWVIIDPTPGDSRPAPTTIVDSGFADMVGSFTFLGEPRLEASALAHGPIYRWACGASRSLIAFAMFLSLCLGLVAIRLRRRWIPGRRDNATERRRRTTTPSFFDAFCRHFGRRGCVRLPCQTPGEYLARLKRLGLVDDHLDEMIDYIYLTRYGGDLPDPEREAQFLVALNHEPPTT